MEEKKHLDYNYFIVLMILILAWKEHNMHKNIHQHVYCNVPELCSQLISLLFQSGKKKQSTLRDKAIAL